MMVKNVKALIGFYLTTCSKNHKVSGFGNKKFQITKIKYLMVRQTHHLEPSRRANHIICQAPERFLAITLRHLPSVLHFPTSNPSAICFLFFALCSLSSDLWHPSSVISFLFSVFIREQTPDIFFRRFADSSFGNKPGYQLCRRDIKCKIGCLA